jgi:hypothetical protein
MGVHGPRQDRATCALRALPPTPPTLLEAIEEIGDLGTLSGDALRAVLDHPDAEPPFA